mmetsp:Transcript_18735/g.70882  ORF Transcript_18735/g.70882 Transcript_18735/m.70882 type:complete len:232 (+) Transcript_18735:201-896(+)
MRSRARAVQRVSWQFCGALEARGCLAVLSGAKLRSSKVARHRVSVSHGGSEPQRHDFGFFRGADSGPCGHHAVSHHARGGGRQCGQPGHGEHHPRISHGRGEQPNAVGNPAKRSESWPCPGPSAFGGGVPARRNMEGRPRIRVRHRGGLLGDRLLIRPRRRGSSAPFCTFWHRRGPCRAGNSGRDGHHRGDVHVHHLLRHLRSLRAQQRCLSGGAQPVRTAAAVAVFKRRC